MDINIHTTRRRETYDTQIQNGNLYLCVVPSIKTVKIEKIADVECAHSYTEKVTKKATCTATGTKTYTCTKCGNSYTTTIPVDKNNHTNIVVLPAKAATCTATGLTERNVLHVEQ